MNGPRTPKAAALEYGGTDAPRVIAQGEGELALLMAAAARRLGTPVIEDESLAEALGALELHSAIPEDLYVAAAVVLSWAYWMTGRTPEDAGKD